jgi:hypothetical protein
MAKPNAPSIEVQKRIAAQTAIKTPGAKEIYEESLYLANRPITKTREQTDGQAIFYLKLVSEAENRINILGRDANEAVEVSPELYKAIYEGGEITGVRAPGGKGTFTSIPTESTLEDNTNSRREVMLGKLGKSGKQTGLNFKYLSAVKNHIFPDEHGNIEGGHQVALATKKLEITLNKVNQIDMASLTPEEAVHIKSFKANLIALLKLLKIVDNLEGKIAKSLGLGSQTAAGEFFELLLDPSNPLGEGIDIGTLSTTDVEFSKETIGQKTTIELEDKDVNRKKGSISGILLKIFNNLALKAIEGNTNFTDIEKNFLSWVDKGNSLSMMQAVELNILNRAIGKNFKGLKKTTKPVRHKEKILGRQKRFKTTPLKAPRRISARPGDRNPFAEVGRIMGFINTKLPQEIIKNMGRPSLENQTGRFASSARIESAIPDTRGLITFNYTYDDRYRGFENSGKYPTQYDPRGLIGKSIRTLATAQAQFKFITRRV